MQTVIMMKWLPASGKSIWAEQYMRMYPNTIRVNKDLARKQYYFKKFDRSKEEFVVKMRNYAIDNALESWYNVIVDDTNFNEVHEEDIRFIAEQHRAEFKIQFVDTWPETCKKRNNNRRSHCVPDYVIDEMYQKAIKQNLHFTECDDDLYNYIPNQDKPKAVIFDIDWTLAKMTTRSPYDYSEAIMTDRLNESVCNTYCLYQEMWYAILIFTGRKAEWNERTQERLEKHEIIYDEFRSRKDWDDRPDAVIKREFFEELEDQYCIECVFDDRDRVVDMWRSMWLQCYQVGYWPF